MAGLLLIPFLLPVAYGTANAGSYVEGKGLRVIGGVLDVGLMVASAYGVGQEYDTYRTMRPEERGVGGNTALTAALFVGNYVALKRLTGSPTSIYTDAAVAGATAGIPLLALLGAGVKMGNS
jgi:hypothetical protein